jgi:hypothetical protein
VSGAGWLPLGSGFEVRIAERHEGFGWRAWRFRRACGAVLEIMSLPPPPPEVRARRFATAEDAVRFFAGLAAERHGRPGSSPAARWSGPMGKAIEGRWRSGDGAASARWLTRVGARNSPK